MVVVLGILRMKTKMKRPWRGTGIRILHTLPRDSDVHTQEGSVMRYVGCSRTNPERYYSTAR